MDETKTEGAMVGEVVDDVRDPLSLIIEMRGEELLRLQRIDWQTFGIGVAAFGVLFIAARVSARVDYLADIVREMTP